MDARSLDEALDGHPAGPAPAVAPAGGRTARIAAPDPEPEEAGLDAEAREIEALAEAIADQLTR